MLRWFTRRLAKNGSPATSTLAEVEIPHDKIAARAAEIWDRTGRPHGQDAQNWAEAEAELRAEFATDREPLPRKSR